VRLISETSTAFGFPARFIFGTIYFRPLRFDRFLISIGIFDPTNELKLRLQPRNLQLATEYDRRIRWVKAIDGRNAVKSGEAQQATRDLKRERKRTKRKNSPTIINAAWIHFLWNLSIGNTKPIPLK
jgi:hypothetical protein